MRIESLRYFIVTADCENMTLSSKLLHTSQQCVSREIKQLEHELGIQLFVRSKSGVILTDEGQKAYQFALPILQQIDAFSKAFSNDATAPFTLTIGSHPGFLTHLNSISKIYQAICPSIIFNEYCISSGQLSMDMQNSVIDLALHQIEKGSTSIGDLSKQYTHFVLLEEPLQALININSANAALNCLPMESLHDFGILFYCYSAEEISLYQHIAQRYSPDLNILYKGNNVQKAQRLFINYHSVSLVTRSLAAQDLLRAPVRLIPVDQDIIISTILSVRLELIDLDYIQALIEVFQAFFQQYQ